MKLELAKELAIPRGLLSADLRADQDRAEQDRLRERHVVAIDQPLRAEVFEPQEAVFILQIREEARRDHLGREAEFAADAGQDRVAVERLAMAIVSEPLAVLGGGGEDLVAEGVGRNLGHDLELGPVLQHLREPSVRQRRQTLADQLVNIRLDLTAGQPHPLAEDHQQALGHFQPLLTLTGQITRNDPLLRKRDPHEVSAEHGSDQVRRTRRGLPDPARSTCLSRNGEAGPSDSTTISVSSGCVGDRRGGEELTEHWHRSDAIGFPRAR